MRENAIFIGFPLIVSLDSKGAYDRIKRPISNNEKATALSKSVESYLKISNDLKSVVIAWLYPASYILSRRNIINKLKMQAVALSETLIDEFRQQTKVNGYVSELVIYSSSGDIKFLPKPMFRDDLDFSEHLVYDLLFLLPCVIYGDEKKLLRWLEKFSKREEKMSDEKVWNLLNHMGVILTEHFDVEIVVLPPLIEEEEIKKGLKEINKEMIRIIREHGFSTFMI